VPAGGYRAEVVKSTQKLDGGAVQDPKSTVLQLFQHVPHSRESQAALGTQAASDTPTLVQFDQIREAGGSLSSRQRTVTEGAQAAGTPGCVHEAFPDEFAVAEPLPTVLAPCVTKKAAV